MPGVIRHVTHGTVRCVGNVDPTYVECGRVLAAEPHARSRARSLDKAHNVLSVKLSYERIALRIVGHAGLLVSLAPIREALSTFQNVLERVITSVSFC